MRGLASEARAVLKVLSLAGRELPARIVAEAIGQEQAAVLRALDGLVRAGLVRLGEQGWGTAHDSISEALVEKLPSAERAWLHAGVAEALRTKGAEIAEVARHLSGAGDYQAAATAFAQSARQALHRFANDEAARLSDAGLALSPAPPIRAALVECRAEARARKGDVGGAKEDLREALSCMSAGPDRARALTSMAMLASGSEDYALADQLIDLALVEAASDFVSRAEVLVAGAIIDINVGRFDRSEARSSEALPLFERMGDASGVARVLDARALATFQAGRLFDAVPALDRAARLLIDTGQLIRAVNPRSMHGNALVLMAQPERGLLDIDQALDLARRLAHPDGESFCLSMRCLALSALGRTAEAVEEGERALDIAEAIGHREWKVISMRALGRAWEAAGNLERAERWLRAALPLSGGMPILSAWVAARLALVLVGRGDLDAAEAYIVRALTEDAPLPLYDARLARAELLAARGDRDAPVVAAEDLARAEAGGYLVVVPRLRELAARQTAP